MTHHIDNALLLHGGNDDMPTPAIRAILTDAICSGYLARENEMLRRQNAALEEANQALANERDFYKQRAHEQEERAMGKVYE